MDWTNIAEIRLRIRPVAGAGRPEHRQTRPDGVGSAGHGVRKSDAEQRDDAEQALAAAARGELTPWIHARFPLERAADAHRELEGRRSVGAIVLTG
jgi:NADPH:quinone reductase-like Zn-dependent oxidoreductase